MLSAHLYWISLLLHKTLHKVSTHTSLHVAATFSTGELLSSTPSFSHSFFTLYGSSCRREREIPTTANASRTWKCSLYNRKIQDCFYLQPGSHWKWTAERMAWHQLVLSLNTMHQLCLQNALIFDDWHVHVCANLWDFLNLHPMKMDKTLQIISLIGLNKPQNNSSHIEHRTVQPSHGLFVPQSLCQIWCLSKGLWNATFISATTLPLAECSRHPLFPRVRKHELAHAHLL